ncbi:MAG: lipocalin family protein [Chitinophagaceae bacterium]|nr:lipocalin family protein [Chitinophagaceae bacterium]
MRHFTLSIIALLLFSAGITSCKKENDKENPTVSIVGKWNYQKLDVTKFENGVQKSSETHTDASGSYIEFKADKTYFAHSYDPDDDTYEDFSGTYTYNHPDLVLHEDTGYEEEYLVKSLTQNSLVIEYTIEYDMSGVHHKDIYSTTLSK